MPVLQVIKSHERDLGGFAVRRVLPSEVRQMVGPFIFFDHLGPAEFAPGTGIDVRPHPHVALSTVSYLFEGSLEHRDSLGSVREILPGDVNWMTAGHGITHSERTPQHTRAQGPHAHGIQSWVALPDGLEDIDPSFTHHAASTLPRLAAGKSDVTVIAGTAYGVESPVVTRWPTLYVHALLPEGESLEIPGEHVERAVYVAQGSISIDGTNVSAGELAILAPGTLAARATIASRLMLLGGERFPTPRYLYWNFVASSRERIERAKERWARQLFPAVPGDDEFIPLPGR